MPQRTKLSLEYVIKSSPKILYSYLHEPKALAQWFADEVNFRNQQYIFIWDGEEHAARLIGSRDNKYVRYRWEEDKDDCYFEMEIIQDELTHDVGLAVTDFVPPDVLAERKRIWDSQVQYLIRVLGA